MGVEFDGNRNKARRLIEETFFGHMGLGSVLLSQLFELYEHFPDITDWQARDFNLRKMLNDLAKAKRQPPRSEGRRY
jgi:hypothetical protein